MKKLDRFDRLVDERTLNPDFLGGYMSPVTAKYLLRRQFTALRRLVAKEKCRFRLLYCLPRGLKHYEGVQACTDILDAMDRWRKGGK